MNSRWLVAMIFAFFAALLAFLLVYSQRKLHLRHYRTIYEAERSTPRQIKEAVQGMTESGNPAVPVLAELLKKESDPDKLRLVIGSLLRIGSPQAVAEAEPFLIKQKASVEATLYHQLLLGKTPAFPKDLSDEPWHRWYVAASLCSAAVPAGWDADTLKTPGPLSTAALAEWKPEFARATGHETVLTQLSQATAPKGAWSREQKKNVAPLLAHPSIAVRIACWEKIRSAWAENFTYDPADLDAQTRERLSRWADE